jgi:hypothetical protein
MKFPNSVQSQISSFFNSQLDKTRFSHQGNKNLTRLQTQKLKNKKMKSIAKY